MITTDKVYKNNSDFGYRETDSWEAMILTVRAKPLQRLRLRAGGQVSVELRRSNPQLLISTARAGNVIGGGDWSPNRPSPMSLGQFKTKTNQLRNPTHRGLGNMFSSLLAAICNLLKCIAWRSVLPSL